MKKGHGLFGREFIYFFSGTAASHRGIGGLAVDGRRLIYALSQRGAHLTAHYGFTTQTF